MRRALLHRWLRWLHGLFWLHRLLHGRLRQQFLTRLDKRILRLVDFALGKHMRLLLFHRAALNLGGSGSDSVTIDRTNPTVTVAITESALSDGTTSSPRRQPPTTIMPATTTAMITAPWTIITPV